MQSMPWCVPLANRLTRWLELACLLVCLATCPALAADAAPVSDLDSYIVKAMRTF